MAAHNGEQRKEAANSWITHELVPAIQSSLAEVLPPPSKSRSVALCTRHVVVTHAAKLCILANVLRPRNQTTGKRYLSWKHHFVKIKRYRDTKGEEMKSSAAWLVKNQVLQRPAAECIQEVSDWLATGAVEVKDPVVSGLINCVVHPSPAAF